MLVSTWPSVCLSICPSVDRIVSALYLPILSHKMSQNSSLWSFSQKVSTGFTAVMVYMLISATVSSVLNIGLASRTNFRVILGPTIDHNSDFQAFFQKFSSGFASYLFYMLFGSTFKCITIMCPTGPISGPRVKVAAELDRPSGRLFFLGVIDIIVFRWMP